MSLLEEALGNPNQIAEPYPSIDLAVKLISGQDTGNISLAGVREMVEEARWPVCLTSPSYVCVVAEALAAAEMVKDDFSRARVLAFGLTDYSYSTTIVILLWNQKKATYIAISGGKIGRHGRTRTDNP